MLLLLLSVCGVCDPGHIGMPRAGLSTRQPSDEMGLNDIGCSALNSLFSCHSYTYMLRAHASVAEGLCKKLEQKLRAIFFRLHMKNLDANISACVLKTHDFI